MASSMQTTPSQANSASANENIANQSTTNPTTLKKSTTFLSIPREIRRKMLLLSWETQLSYNPRPVWSELCIPKQFADERNTRILNLERSWIGRWYHKLERVDPCIRDDIEYVRRKHLDHVKEAEKECEWFVRPCFFLWDSRGNELAALLSISGGIVRRVGIATKVFITHINKLILDLSSLRFLHQQHLP